MSAQTSYAINQPKAYAGLIYALHPHDNDSFSVEGSAGINFGVAVSRGTDPERQVVLGGTNFVGITYRSLEREGAANTGAVKYNENETAGVMREGYIWAVCPAGCTAGDPVFYTDADGVLDAGTAAAGQTQLDGATWETTTVAGELGVIRLQSTDTTAGA